MFNIVTEILRIHSSSAYAFRRIDIQHSDSEKKRQVRKEWINNKVGPSWPE